MITKFVATDRKSGQYVFVAANVYSVNGCEPQPVPDEYREMDARAAAKMLLAKLVANDPKQ